MQTITSPEDLRRASGRAALATARVAVLASLLVLSVAPRAGAQQDPPGCDGTGFLGGGFFVERADGSNAGAGSQVSPCETIQYKGSLTGGTTPACCFEGGTPRITTPRTCASDADCTDNPGGKCGTETACGTEITGQCSYDVTPAGGVPKKCPGDGAIDTLTVQYQVREQDIGSATCPPGTPPGTICARIDFTAAESFTGTPTLKGWPFGSSAVSNTVVPCPPSTRCVISRCDPNLQGTGADEGRTGLCTTVPRRTPACRSTS